MQEITIKPRINKKNGQINFSLPKKQMSKNFLKDSHLIKSMKIKIKGWNL